MRLVRITSQFKKALKKILKSGRFSRSEIQNVVERLARREDLRESHNDHKLSGELAYHRECHIRSDLLLVYRIENNDLVLVLVNVGSHSDLF
jgi:mRNA interferase YafQ